MECSPVTTGIVVTGTLPGACYAEGMTAFLTRGHSDIRLSAVCRAVARCDPRSRSGAGDSAGIAIEHIAKAHIRKEEVVAKVLERRGDHPGLVHIISAMEACQSYRPWHDKTSGKTFLKPDSSKCLHYYFYFIEPQVGLCYLRVPNWCPFRLQFYCNGHGWLARKLKPRRIGFTHVDNAFVRMDDCARAQPLADASRPNNCTASWIASPSSAARSQDLDQGYHWSLMQVEYATDLVFRSPEMLSPCMNSFPAKRCWG